ncbi:MAG: antibiotic biosynthesis monooxygenase [Bacteroidota bacterium]
MIARIWNGKTRLAHKEAYIDFMKSRALPDYQTTTGFVKLEFLCQTVDDIAHFKLITFWENLEVIQNFAGEDYEKAKYYPEDDGFLLDFPEKVEHYEVFASVN